MAAKLKGKAEASGEDIELADGIRASAGQIWLAGLGAFAKAQREGVKVFNGLVEEGERVQKRAKKTVEETFSDVSSKASKSWDKVSWAQLEGAFVDRVVQTLHTLSIPTKQDLDALNHRISKLTAVTKKLSEEMAELPQTDKQRAHRAKK